MGLALALASWAHPTLAARAGPTLHLLRELGPPYTCGELGPPYAYRCAGFYLLRGDRGTVEWCGRVHKVNIIKSPLIDLRNWPLFMHM